MKIYAISDLHLEFYSNHEQLLKVLKPILPKADVLILAGDIGDPINGHDNYLNLLKAFKLMYSHVLLIAGNHEYYESNCDMNLSKKFIKSICEESKVTFLDNQSAIIDNIKFVGTTLWSKGDKYIQKCISDFGRVFNNIDDYNKEHDACFKWLKEELLIESKTNTCSDMGEQKFDRTVVITHHLPSSKLCHPRYASYAVINTAFCTEILDKLNLSNVSLWVCGHTHESKIYMHPKNVNEPESVVKIVVNPVGYPKEVKFTKVLTDVHEI